MATRLFAFAPQSTTELLAFSWLRRAPGLALGGAVVGAAAVLTAGAAGAAKDGVGQLGIMFAGGLDLSVPLFVVQLALVGIAVVTTTTSPAADFTPLQNKGKRQGAARAASVASPPSARGRFVRLLLVAVAAAHAFVLPLLGLQDCACFRTCRERERRWRQLRPSEA